MVKVTKSRKFYVVSALARELDKLKSSDVKRICIKCRVKEQTKDKKCDTCQTS